MAIQFIKVKCPECGATLNIEKNRDMAYCTYCGTKVLIHNENERIFRHIDEARIREVEVDRMIRLKELEIYEKEQEEKRKRIKERNKLLLRLIIIGVLLLLIGCLLGSATGDEDSPLYFIAMAGMFPLIAAFSIWSDNSNKKE